MQNLEHEIFKNIVHIVYLFTILNKEQPYIFNMVSDFWTPLYIKKE